MGKGLRRALAGDLSLFGGLPSDEATAARLRAHHIANVIGDTQSLMLANACNALVLVLAFWNSPNRSVAIVWASILIAAVGANYIRRIRRPKPPPQSASEAAVLEVVWRAVVLGGLWSAAPLLFFEDASAGQQLIIACLCTGMLCGGAMALKSIPIAAISFMLPIFVGSGVALARTGDHTYWLAGALMLVYSTVFVRVVLANARQAVGSLLQQFDVEQRVRTDPLTGLPNRIWFQESLEVAFSRLRRNHERFALFCFDLDNFKVVNDRMGHSAGDELLIQVAERLKKCTRLGDTLARIGGDEFVLVAANVDTRQQASIIASRIVTAFRTPFVVDSLEVLSAVSIGIGLAPIDGVDARELIRS